VIEPQEREIDGLTFRYTPLMATQARNTLVGLINRFGGSIADGLDGLGEADFSEATEGVDIAQMLGKMTASIAGFVRQLTTNLTPEYYEKLCDTFGARSEVKQSHEGQEAWPQMSKGTRDMLFATKLLTEAKWIGFCLEVQYSDFFELAKTGSQRAIALKWMSQKKIPLQSVSPQDSTGTSKE